MARASNRSARDHAAAHLEQGELVARRLARRRRGTARVTASPAFACSDLRGRCAGRPAASRCGPSPPARSRSRVAMSASGPRPTRPRASVFSVDLHRLLEVAVLQRQLHRPVRLRLAGAAEQLDHVVRRRTSPGAGPRSCPSCRSRSARTSRRPPGRSAGSGSGSSPSPSSVTVSAASRGGTRNSWTDSRSSNSLKSGTSVDDGDAVVVGRRDPQLHVLEQLHRHRLAVEEQRRPDEHRRRPAGSAATRGRRGCRRRGGSSPAGGRWCRGRRSRRGSARSAGGPAGR